MKQILMIPDRNCMEACEELATKYHLGYEFNDFYQPDVLDDKDRIQRIIDEYKERKLPSCLTMHGAFYDVLPTSTDKEIRHIGQMRIEQSIECAKNIGAKAVIFHTNYNPFLNNKEYVRLWTEENIKYWESVLSKHSDIAIYLENMFDISPEIIAELAERLSRFENFGLCFDYAHAALSGTELKLWAQTLGKYVKHIHLNDNDLISDLHQAWGSGCIDRQSFYENYQEYMRNASILIETTSLDNIRKSLEVLQKDGFLTQE